MTREEAKKWLESLRIKDFGWDDYAMQESQTEIRERCENAIREAINMAIEALSADAVGKWNKFDTGIYLCSNCNWAVGNEYNYCPCCGTKMERGDADEG